METFASADLVIYHPQDSDRVVDVKEFEVAKAVINKQLAVLSEGVPTWEGRWHLFDMCLWFGHVDVAWAMAEAGTQGCAVEDYHLGPYTWHDVKIDDSNAWGFPSTHGIWMKDWNYKLEMAEKAGMLPCWPGAALHCVRGCYGKAS